MTAMHITILICIVIATLVGGFFFGLLITGKSEDYARERALDEYLEHRLQEQRRNQ